MASKVKQCAIIGNGLFSGSLVTHTVTIPQLNLFPVFEIVFLVSWQYSFPVAHLRWRIVRTSHECLRSLGAAFKSGLITWIRTPASTFKVKINFRRISTSWDIITARGAIQTKRGSRVQFYQIIVLKVVIFNFIFIMFRNINVFSILTLIISASERNCQSANDNATNNDNENCHFRIFSTYGLLSII